MILFFCGFFFEILRFSSLLFNKLTSVNLGISLLHPDVLVGVRINNE